MIRKIGILAAVFAAGTAMADGMSIMPGGYVDAGWNWSKAGTNTFSVNETGFTLSGTMGNTKAMFGVDPTIASLTAGGPKNQYWVWHKYDMGLSWKMGRFHDITGSEGKYTVDIPFTMHSVLTGMMPWAHTGLLMGYMINDTWGVDLMIANDNAGATKGAKMTKGNPDFGVRLSGKMPELMINEFTGTYEMSRTVPGNLKPWLFNGILDMQFAALHLRGDLVMKSSGVTGASSQMGVGGYALYDLTDMYSAGLRAAIVKNQTVGSNKLEVTVGGQSKLSKNMTAKLDYTLGNPAVVTGGTATESHMINLAAVYKF